MNYSSCKVNDLLSSPWFHNIFYHVCWHHIVWEVCLFAKFSFLGSRVNKVKKALIFHKQTCLACISCDPCDHAEGKGPSLALSFSNDQFNFKWTLAALKAKIWLAGSLCKLQRNKFWLEGAWKLCWHNFGQFACVWSELVKFCNNSNARIFLKTY